MIRKRRNQKETPTPKKRGWIKILIDNEVLIHVLRKHIGCQDSSYFPIGGPSINRT